MVGNESGGMSSGAPALSPGATPAAAGPKSEAEARDGAPEPGGGGDRHGPAGACPWGSRVTAFAHILDT